MITQIQWLTVQIFNQRHSSNCRITDNSGDFCLFVQIIPWLSYNISKIKTIVLYIHISQKCTSIKNSGRTVSNAVNHNQCVANFNISNVTHFTFTTQKVLWSKTKTKQSSVLLPFWHGVFHTELKLIILKWQNPSLTLMSKFYITLKIKR